MAESFGVTSSYVDLSAAATRSKSKAAALDDVLGLREEIDEAYSGTGSLYTASLGVLKPEHEDLGTAAEDDTDTDTSEGGTPYLAYSSYRCNKKSSCSKRASGGDDPCRVETSSTYAPIQGTLNEEDDGDGGEIRETNGGYTDAIHYSTFVSPRSGEQTEVKLDGYSTAVLDQSSGAVPLKADTDYFPVIEALPADKKSKEIKGGSKGASPFSEEEAVMQKVAALLASLPSDKSRQRVVAQLKAGANDDRSDFEVLKPTATIKQEKEWAKADEGRQWNEEYQQVVGKGLKQLLPDDVRTIARLNNDFVRHAETYAKVIINELNVPVHRKTIKPAGVGGVAGGAKYIVQGILFKFCLDPLVSKKPPVWLYGGERPDDEHATKAAGLELQGLGLVATSQIAQLRHPLMALIDYKGFRMVATCLLPIGPDTLKYGSNDAGRTIKTGDVKLDHMMDLLGQHLNLRKHLVGKQQVAIVGPGDIEGHLGTDGRYYLLDYARLMPPETPLPDEDGNLDGRGVFFRMLRPELVRSFRLPLSSDTFTGWGMYDENRTAYELDVREATNLVIEERIPELAKEISQLYQEGLCDGRTITPAQLQEIVEHLNLVARMHSRGVNLRHLGRLRGKVVSSRGQRLIFSLALSRACKSKLRKRMRRSIQNQQHSGVSSESACKDVVLHFFNTVLSHTDEAEHFWRVGVKKTLKKKFPFILTEEEDHEDYDLRQAGCIKLTFMLCFKMGLVQFPNAVTEAIFKDPTSVRLVETDILCIPATVKHTHLTHIFNGNICMFEAAKGNHKASDALRLLRQAREHMMTATNMAPSCPYANWVLATVEVDMASRLLFDQEAERLFTTSYTRFEAAYQLDKTNRGPLDSWADGLEQHAARLAANDGDPARVEELRSLAAAKRHLAAAAVGVTTCSLLTSRG